ncbi:hypothetical protein DFH06DRAFT_1437566 [Mycena polygramma]|nr:hypothetical protein DFH06DRAFT_1437566 [Mycena polygramma]
MGRHHDNVNRITDGAPDINDNPRDVFIGYRMVGGAVAGWITTIGLGFFKRPNIGRTHLPPNPACHWCVTVGDHLHQLQATSLNHGWNYYDNDRIEVFAGTWALYKVGTTSFNDIAIKNAAITCMDLMPEMYDVYDNNCQSFAIKLLDAICRAGRTKVHTSYSLTKLQIAYLDADELEAAEAEGREIESAVPEDEVEHLEFLAAAQEIMDEQTAPFTEEEEEGLFAD